MRRFFLKLLVAALTFTVSTTVTSLRQRGQAEPKPPVAAAVPVIYFSEPEDDGRTLPESLSPTDIEIFINKHPGADLTRIWQAVGINDNDAPDAVAECASCKAETFFYDLDNEPGDEALLKVADPTRDAARFVVFKPIDLPDKWRVLGHADIWGKYIEPYHMILVSGGKTWLVIRGQAASGSGVASYNEYIFQITRGRLRRIIGYPAAGHQSGASDSVTHEFTARPLSCEVKDGRSVLELDLYVVYSAYDRESGTYAELFAKRQRATLIKKLGSDYSFLDPNRSNLSQDEFESVYNVDSLDFVRYNFRELSEIAAGKSRGIKKWLGNYLKTCEPTAEVRKLQRMLTE